MYILDKTVFLYKNIAVSYQVGGCHNGESILNLSRSMLNVLCGVCGAALTMAFVTARSFGSGQRPDTLVGYPLALGYLLYASIAGFVVVASYEQKTEGRSSEGKVTTSVVVFVVATLAGIAAHYSGIFWPWATAMMGGILLFIPSRIAHRLYS